MTTLLNELYKMDSQKYPNTNSYGYHIRNVDLKEDYVNFYLDQK